MSLNQSMHHPTSSIFPSTPIHSTAQLGLASVVDQWGPRTTSPSSLMFTHTRIVSLTDGTPC
jgi:hypothetical protein